MDTCQLAPAATDAIPTEESRAIGRSPAIAEAWLTDSLEWLSAFERRHPQYGGACRYRRATLLANHGRLLVEHGEPTRARPYLPQLCPPARRPDGKPLVCF